jgi:2-polyprenyl-3-methyl-5-hydroxy-6-metoxy-1,4-benzoquinol methylase
MHSLSSTTSSTSLDELRQRIDSLRTLSRKQLDDLHFHWEVACASAIKKSLRGSSERAVLFTSAYDGLTTILREMRIRDCRNIDAPMGFNPTHLEEICATIGPAPRTVLDVGCSTGTLVRALLSRGYDAYGIDVSAETVTRAKELTSNSFGRDVSDKFVTGNFLCHDFGDQTFDFMHTNDVLEHIHPDEAGEFLSRCRSLMRPNGVLWLVTPNRLTGPGDATTLQLPWGTPAIGLHLKEYTLAELSALLRRSGFARVECRLFTTGRGRSATKPRSIYTRVKLALEPVLATIPVGPRKRIMAILDYSLTIARP